VGKFVPTVKFSTGGGPPLFGAQQIPGKDETLRVGEVSFPSSSYARSEIVKASSALTVANQIIDKIQEEGIVPFIPAKTKLNPLLASISKPEIDKMAAHLALSRSYPEALSRLVIERD